MAPDRNRLYLLLIIYSFINISYELADYCICVNNDCSEKVSEAQATQNYSPRGKDVIRLKEGQIINIYGKCGEYFAVEIEKKKGLVPKNMVKEQKVVNKNYAVQVKIDTFLGRNSAIGNEDLDKHQEKSPAKASTWKEPESTSASEIDTRTTVLEGTENTIPTDPSSSNILASQQMTDNKFTVIDGTTLSEAHDEAIIPTSTPTNYNTASLNQDFDTDLPVDSDGRTSDVLKNNAKVVPTSTGDLSEQSNIQPTSETHEALSAPEGGEAIASHEFVPTKTYGGYLKNLASSAMNYLTGENKATAEPEDGSMAKDGKEFDGNLKNEMADAKERTPVASGLVSADKLDASPDEDGDEEDEEGDEEGDDEGDEDEEDGRSEFNETSNAESGSLKDSKEFFNDTTDNNTTEYSDTLRKSIPLETKENALKSDNTEADIVSEESKASNKAILNENGESKMAEPTPLPPRHQISANDTTLLETDVASSPLNEIANQKNEDSREENETAKVGRKLQNEEEREPENLKRETANVIDKETSNLSASNEKAAVDKEVPATERTPLVSAEGAAGNNLKLDTNVREEISSNGASNESLNISVARNEEDGEGKGKAIGTETQMGSVAKASPHHVEERSQPIPEVETLPKDQGSDSVQSISEKNEQAASVPNLKSGSVPSLNEKGNADVLGNGGADFTRKEYNEDKSLGNAARIETGSIVETRSGNEGKEKAAVIADDVTNADQSDVGKNIKSAEAAVRKIRSAISEESESNVSSTGSQIDITADLNSTGVEAESEVMAGANGSQSYAAGGETNREGFSTSEAKNEELKERKFEADEINNASIDSLESQSTTDSNSREKEPEEKNAKTTNILEKLENEVANDSSEGSLSNPSQGANPPQSDSNESVTETASDVLHKSEAKSEFLESVPTVNADTKTADPLNDASRVVNLPDVLSSDEQNAKIVTEKIESLGKLNSESRDSKLKGLFEDVPLTEEAYDSYENKITINDSEDGIGFSEGLGERAAGETSHYNSEDGAIPESPHFSEKAESDDQMSEDEFSLTNAGSDLDNRLGHESSVHILKEDVAASNEPNSNYNSENYASSDNLEREARELKSDASSVLINFKECIQTVIEWIPEPAFSFLMEMKASGLSPHFVFAATSTGALAALLLVLLCYLQRGSKELFLRGILCKAEEKIFKLGTENKLRKEELENAKTKELTLEAAVKASQAALKPLREELVTSKNRQGLLEETVASLEQQLESSAEAGLELNQMLSEFLTSQNQSSELHSMLEHLQGQLNAQRQMVDNSLSEANQREQDNTQLRRKIEELEAYLFELEKDKNQWMSKCGTVEEEYARSQQLGQELDARLQQLEGSKDQLLQEAFVWNQRVEELQRELEADRENKLVLESNLKGKEEEINVLNEVVLQVKALKLQGQEQGDWEKFDETLKEVTDASKVRLQLKEVEKEFELIKERLTAEQEKSWLLESQSAEAEKKMQSMKDNCTLALQDKTEAQTKLEVLTNYFKEKEIQMQKELGVQEAMRQQKEVDASSSSRQLSALQQECQSYKSQIASLKQELEETERSYKSQVSVHEKKAHESWLASRSVERKLEEQKQEATVLRQRLTLLERDVKNAAEINLKRPIARNGELPVDQDSSSDPMDPINEDLKPRLPTDRPLPPPGPFMLPPFPPMHMIPPPLHMMGPLPPPGLPFGEPWRFRPPLPPPMMDLERRIQSPSTSSRGRSSPGRDEHFRRERASPGREELFRRERVSPGRDEHFRRERVSPGREEHYRRERSPGREEHYRRERYSPQSSLRESSRGSSSPPPLPHFHNMPPPPLRGFGPPPPPHFTAINRRGSYNHLYNDTPPDMHRGNEAMSSSSPAGRQSRTPEEGKNSTAV